LKEMKNSATFYLLQTDQLVTKIDGSDSGCSQHISSNRKMFSSYTLVQGREVFMRNFATLAKEQSSFGLMMDVSLLFKAFVMFLN